jgi:hypothetical protein
MNRAAKNSYKTAIYRYFDFTAPTKFLLKNKYIKRNYDGCLLDFGCGKSFDADLLDGFKYDPYYEPSSCIRMTYDYILCSYVLNVLLKKDESKILKQIKLLLNKNGIAYITVRRNIKKEGYTSKGTYQRNVILNLPIIKENRDYCIYKLSK